MLCRKEREREENFTNPSHVACTFPRHSHAPTYTTLIRPELWEGPVVLVIIQMKTRLKQVIFSSLCRARVWIQIILQPNPSSQWVRDPNILWPHEHPKWANMVTICFRARTLEIPFLIWYFLNGAVIFRYFGRLPMVAFLFRNLNIKDL